MNNKEQLDIAVIGGGCAGLSAALSAKAAGAENIAIFERGPCLGGVLRQCIHNGFGIHRFGEDLTGTQYASRLVRALVKSDIQCLTSTTVLSLSGRALSVLNPTSGLREYEAKAVVLATGCRERTRGALLIPGSRPAGIMTAGTAQRYLNLEGLAPGKKIMILGSGDIGLIMARQFTLEGFEVVAIAEVMPYSSGLTRNIVQCVEDFGIPLYYNTTVTRIIGQARIEGVYLAEVDTARNPIDSTERFVSCDALVLSVGLIPENELAFDAGITLSPVTGGPLVDDALQTSTEGVFACGNALHVHDLVDFVSEEAERTGRSAALFAAAKSPISSETIRVEEGPGVLGVVPQHIRLDGRDEMVRLQFRPAARVFNKSVCVFSDGHCITKKHHRVLTPGEMCQIDICRSDIRGTVTVRIND